jgi:hypothetical protein
MVSVCGNLPSALQPLKRNMRIPRQVADTPTVGDVRYSRCCKIPFPSVLDEVSHLVVPQGNKLKVLLWGPNDSGKPWQLGTPDAPLNRALERKLWITTADCGHHVLTVRPC